MNRLHVILLCLIVSACECETRRPLRDAALEANTSDVLTFDARIDGDAPDTTCATTTAMTEIERQPVDIIWVVDNSNSMRPAVEQVTAGINAFADLIANSGLDYRVIMLSQQGRSTTDSVVCIPPPLSGDNDCGDGERFFHVDVNIRSSQPIEQFLGTLAQSEGYGCPGDGITECDARSSLPWRDLLRSDSAKTIVLVSDDNSRTCDNSAGANCQPGDPALTLTSLEDFPGGGNPFSSRDLGPGILTDEYGTLFEGYTFSGIYGWGDENDPEVPCSFSASETADSPGQTYTALVERTGGVRAQICDGAAAWEPFFEAVAGRVTDRARVDCELDLPEPPDGEALDPTKVNVVLELETDVALLKVMNEGFCGSAGGWYYDDDENPTKVILCPASCETTQETLLSTGEAGVSVQFGCNTLFI